MKQFLVGALFLIQILNSTVYAQSVGIGTNSPSANAQLDVSSTTKGMLIPRMTQGERDLLTTEQGLLIYNITSNSFQYHNGTAWSNITHSGIASGIPNRIPRFLGPWGLTPGLMTDNGAGVSLNNTAAIPDGSAILDVSSTTKGVLIPRMTFAQRNAIGAPATGLLIYQTDFVAGFYYYSGTVWTAVSQPGSSNWIELNGHIYNGNGSGNVGIGSSTPFEKLTVDGNVVTSGGIGIGTATPDLLSYRLDVNGIARFRSDLYVNRDQYVTRDVWIDRNLDVDGTSNLLGNIVAGSNLNIAGSITAVDNVTVSGNVVVDGNKGIVRSTNSLQRVVSFPSGSVSFGNAPAGYTVDVTFGLADVFSSNPIISLGQVSATSGNFERWSYTIHSVNYTTNSFEVRFYTAAGTGGSTAMTLNFIAIGPAL